MADSFSGITFRYAGFWLRLIAAAIDAGILLIVIWLLGFVFSVDITAPVHDGADFLNFRLFELTAIFSAWMYFGVMESAAPQATVGKLFMGIYVTDIEGERLTFPQASMRYWAKYLSVFTLLIGFLLAAFTRQKQALHDRVVKSLVLKR
ncbi:MAG: putative RDD family membrane protein YckC [Alphaproteobacteria bacterium]|jgi:uncharacterized RDD family membrane protein YckC